MNQTGSGKCFRKRRVSLGLALLMTLLLMLLNGYHPDIARAAGGDKGEPQPPAGDQKGEPRSPAGENKDDHQPVGEMPTEGDTLQVPDSLMIVQALEDSIATALETAILDSIARADSIALVLETQSLYQSGVAHFASSGWWVYGDSGFVARSIDGREWRRLTLPTTEPLLCADGQGEHIFLGSRDGRIYDMVQDSVVSIHTLDTTLAINDISLKPDGEGLCVGDEGLIGKTTDSGVTWNRLETSFENRWYQVEPNSDEWLLSGSGGLLVSLQSDTIRHQLHPGTNEPLRVLATRGDEILLGRRGLIYNPLSTEELQLPRPRQQVYDIAYHGDTLLAAVYGGVALMIPDAEYFLPLHHRYLVTGLAVNAGKVIAVGTHGRAWSIDLEDSLRVSDLITGARREAPVGVSVAAEVTSTSTLADSTQRVEEAGEETAGEYIFDRAGFRYGNACDISILPSLSGAELSRKVGQLNDYGPLNVAGRVLQKLYISSEGDLVEQELLAVYPYGLKYARSSERVLRALTFEPAQCAGQPVDAWMYISIPFDTSATDYGFIMNGELELHNELRTEYPEFSYPEVMANSSEKLEQLHFPGRARRFVWRGEAIVEYDLDSSGQTSNFSICEESEGDFQFGQAAIDFLQSMDIRPATVNSHKTAVHVIHHVIQDRKRKEYKTPGFFGRLFGGTPDSIAIADSSYIDKVIFAWPQLTRSEVVLGEELMRNHYTSENCSPDVDSLQFEMTMVIDFGGKDLPVLQSIVTQHGDPLPGDLFSVISDMMIAPGMTGRYLAEAESDTFFLRIDSVHPDSCRFYPLSQQQ
jgi:TonB family protein